MLRILTHPGEVLHQEYMVPLKLSARPLANQLDVPPNRVTEIVRGQRRVSADAAIRLSRRFGTSPQFWLNMQNAYDLSMAAASHDSSSVQQVEQLNVCAA